MPSYQEVYDALCKLIVYIKEEGGWLSEYLDTLEEIRDKMWSRASDGYG